MGETIRGGEEMVRDMGFIIWIWEMGFDLD